MTSAVLTMAAAVAAEKSVPVADVLAAIEVGFAAAVRRRLQAPAARVSVRIDPQTGDVSAVRTWTAVAQVANPDAEQPAGERPLGTEWEEELEPPALTRQTAHSVHQVVVQRLREAVKRAQAGAWAHRVGDVVYGTVSRVDKKDGAWVALADGTEAFLGRTERIPGEPVKVGQRLRAVLVAADAQAVGSALVLSRRAPTFLEALLRAEVPEIGDGLIEIAAVAREPGQRAKVGVRAKPGFRGDPIGACIGMRGARIQAVTDELAGERIDVVAWDDGLPQRVLNALAPAEVDRLVVDEDKGVVWAAVAEDRLARAIGRGGQNVRLASRLLGLDVRVMGPQALADVQEAERLTQRGQLKDDLGVDDELADALLDAGFAGAADLTAPGAAAFLSADFDDDLVAELLSRARETVLNAELLQAEREAAVLAPFAGVDGLSFEQASLLHARGVRTTQDVADLAADELVDLTQWPAEVARSFILSARRAPADPTVPVPSTEPTEESLGIMRASCPQGIEADETV